MLAEAVYGMHPLIFVLVILAIIAVIVWLVRRV